jgi:LmbE family N-acetylglucosaminyl deacetylase
MDAPVLRADDVLARMASLPFAHIATILGRAPVLILAPHPDDESLGCGGLIAQACAAGHEVHVAILTDGTMSHPNSRAFPAARLAALRQTEAADALATLGLPPERLVFLGYKDAAAPRSGKPLRDAGDRLAGLLREHRVGTVIASWRHDPHCDHLAAHRIAARAGRLTGARHLSYAVWGWTLPPARVLPHTPVRGWRLDVTPNLAVKRQAIDCHRSQMTGLIDDDPDGFTVPPTLLDLCNRTFEAYLCSSR